MEIRLPLHSAQLRVQGQSYHVNPSQIRVNQSQKRIIIKCSYGRTIMNHFLNTDGYHREETYQMTMYFVRRMCEKGFLTDGEYEAIDTRMRQKYQPIFVTFMEQI